MRKLHTHVPRLQFPLIHKKKIGYAILKCFLFSNTSREPARLNASKQPQNHHLAIRSINMAIGSATSSSSSALHLNFPPSAGAGVLNSRSSSGVQVHPVALFSILDHYLRRSDQESEEDGETEKAEGENAPSKTRVIGTLLGTRNGTEVEIRSCFAVPHLETSEQVQIGRAHV